MERSAAVRGIGEVLRGHTVTGKDGLMRRRGIVEEERGIGAVSDTQMIRGIREAAAGEHGAVFIGVQHVAALAPVDEVAGDGMAPVHVAPGETGGVVLIIEVVDAVRIDEAVGVVCPAVASGEVRHRAVFRMIAALAFPFRGEGGRIGQRRGGIRRHAVEGGIAFDGQSHAGKAAEVYEHILCAGVVRCVGDVEVIDKGAFLSLSVVEAELGQRRVSGDGQDKVPPFGAAGKCHHSGLLLIFGVSVTWIRRG